MIKAGALYFAIVIAFFLAIISASLIMLAAHYRSAYLKEIRLNRLQHNLESGIAYILASNERTDREYGIDLYGDETDSVTLNQWQWGIFDLAVLHTFISQDTLTKAFLIGTTTDSTVLYLSDEDRPLSVSGTTKITGNVEIPKSGMKQSYAEGKPYQGKQMVYEGKTSNSRRTLKQLSQKLITNLQTGFKTDQQIPMLAQKDIKGSFLDSTQRFNLARLDVIENVKLSGNIILYSDSAITIGPDAQLNGIQLYAKSIRIESGFKGNAQFFATDSIVIVKGATLTYPSVLGIIKPAKAEGQPHITLGENVKFDGIIFTYEPQRSTLQTLISLGKDAKVRGEVYSAGFVKVEKGVSIEGKVSCNRFMMRTPTTLYENFLIDVFFNRKARSQYYLSSKLFEDGKQNKVLAWLN
jgi:cytoskeletal protein CcmA (bactofilin family)